MPIYEYRCNACHQINEVLVLGKEEAPTCSGCGSQDLEKIISAHNTLSAPGSSFKDVPSGCCGTPGSCGSPGSCCSS